MRKREREREYVVDGSSMLGVVVVCEEEEEEVEMVCTLALLSTRLSVGPELARTRLAPENLLKLTSWYSVVLEPEAGLGYTPPNF